MQVYSTRTESENSLIHDAQVEVTCDAEHCCESVYVTLRAGTEDTYSAKDSTIERSVERHEGWFVQGGQHYCCAEHVPAPKAKTV